MGWCVTLYWILPYNNKNNKNFNKNNIHSFIIHSISKSTLTKHFKQNWKNYANLAQIIFKLNKIYRKNQNYEKRVWEWNCNGQIYVFYSKLIALKKSKKYVDTFQQIEEEYWKKNISKCLDNILKSLRIKFKNNLELYLCYLFELFTFIFR